ncbi:MAG: class I SAM-dependent methyltransferase [Bacteroidia bacterium]|nr:class I SAM-dependent methyltransferase [Bacteroidia bacterium]
MNTLITIDKDPIGSAILDYFSGNKADNIEVITNVALDEDLDPGYFFRTFDDMPEIEKLALQLCSGKVLDVGAGAGSHALYLQENSFEVFALDVSPLSVELMKKRGVKNVLLQNFYSIKNEKYDTLLFLMNGFGMSAKLKNVVPFLKHCMSLLNDDGQIIFDSSDLKYLHEQEDGSYIFDLNASYYGEVTYQLNYKNVKGEPFDWLFLDVDKLRTICDEQNWTLDVIMEDSHYQYLARISKTA